MLESLLVVTISHFIINVHQHTCVSMSFPRVHITCFGNSWITYLDSFLIASVELSKFNNIMHIVVSCYKISMPTWFFSFLVSFPIFLHEAKDKYVPSACIIFFWELSCMILRPPELNRNHQLFRCSNEEPSPTSLSASQVPSKLFLMLLFYFYIRYSFYPQSEVLFWALATCPISNEASCQHLVLTLIMILARFL